MSHTPGPWHWSGDSLTHRQFDIYAPAKSPQQHICTVNNLSVEKLWARDADQAIANARLIAAAPDLLAALKDAKLWVAQYLSLPNHAPAAECMLRVIRRAIQQAQGE